jgi:hypothetical protein
LIYFFEADAKSSFSSLFCFLNDAEILSGVILGESQNIQLSKKVATRIAPVNRNPEGNHSFSKPSQSSKVWKFVKKSKNMGNPNH